MRCRTMSCRRCDGERGDRNRAVERWSRHLSRCLSRRRSDSSRRRLCRSSCRSPRLKRRRPCAAWDGRDRELARWSLNSTRNLTRNLSRSQRRRRNRRRDACGAEWARRSAHRPLRLLLRLALGQDWVWTTASTCRSRPIRPARGQRCQCRRGLTVGHRAGAGTLRRFAVRAARAG